MLKTARLFILLNSRNIHEFSLRPINNKLFNIIIIIIIINIINSNNNSMKYLASVLFIAKSKSIKSQLQLIKVGHLGKLKVKKKII